jgi:CDP-glucose 4,6-dehydratase
MVSVVPDQLRSISGPVLITGHTGFKGTWLSLLLEEFGIEVIGISKKPEKNSLYNILNRKGKIREVFIDLADEKKVNKFVKNVKPKLVIHLAAQALVLRSYKEPLETFMTNVMGTANLMQASFANPSVRGIIVSTTDKVYHNQGKNIRFKEDDPLLGKDPYSASKVGTENVINAWRQISLISGGPKINAVRAGNVIGGGDQAEGRLMPDIIRHEFSNESLKIRNYESTRPWQHVLDPLYGYLLAGQSILNGKDFGTFNFGPVEPSLTVAELINVVKSGGYLKTFIPKTAQAHSDHESKFLDLDSTKARETLGWKPTWSQEEAILSTLGWWSQVRKDKISAFEACALDISYLIQNISK